MPRKTERLLLEWLAANEPRFVMYSISIGVAWPSARGWLFERTGLKLSERQFRRVVLYARTTGYLKEWRGHPHGVDPDARGQQFFEFVAA